MEILSRYLTPDEPFGPIDGRLIDDPEVHEQIFEQQYKVFAGLVSRPSIVIGRKGSGKTSCLNSAHFNNYNHVLNLDTAEAFANVIRAINEKAEADAAPVFAETVTKIWRQVIYITLLYDIERKLPSNYRSRRSISDYLALVDLVGTYTIEEVLAKVSRIISNNSGSKDGNLSEKPAGFFHDIMRMLHPIEFDTAIEELINDLKQNKHRAVILLDSLDDFKMHLDSVGIAIQGLLKFIGESNGASSPIELRFCLPAELYHKFMGISSNPNKDFSRKLILNWDAKELISMASHRLKLFVSCHPQDWLSSNLRSNSYDTHPDLILRGLFPSRLKCRLGVEEDPIAYLVRHTQLLPRHLLLILNSICKASRRHANPSSKYIDEKYIRDGVVAVEENLVKEIFVAYKAVYPNAEDVCRKCLPELHHVFTIGDLERVFRSHGKKALQSDDFQLFMEMLIEIGAVGRVVERSQKYIQAQFAYNIPHKLVTRTDDSLCIHPLFSEIFNVKISEKKPVYTFGTRLEE